MHARQREPAPANLLRTKPREREARGEKPTTAEKGENRLSTRQSELNDRREIATLPRTASVDFKSKKSLLKKRKTYNSKRDPSSVDNLITISERKKKEGKKDSASLARNTRSARSLARRRPKGPARIGAGLMYRYEAEWRVVSVAVC